MVIHEEFEVLRQSEIQQSSFDSINFDEMLYRSAESDNPFNKSQLKSFNTNIN